MYVSSICRVLNLWLKRFIVFLSVARSGCNRGPRIKPFNLSRHDHSHGVNYILCTAFAFASIQTSVVCSSQLKYPNICDD